MARFCHCGRPLDGPDAEKYHEVEKPRVGPVFEIAASGRVRPTMRRHKQRSCKMRLIATSPVTGKTLVPGGGRFAPQRTTELNTRYVHESRFQPGGDLA